MSGLWFLLLFIAHLQFSVRAQQLLSTSRYQPCCADADATAVLRCVNASLASAEQSSFAAGAPYLLAGPISVQGPSLSVVILTRVTKDIFEYAAWSLFLQAVYAERNGYSLLALPDRENTAQSDYQYYRKLSPMIEAMEGAAFHSDYFVWMDADLVVLDLDMRIEQIAAAYPAAHILMSADVSSVANTGMIIVRNTAWSLQFLRDWLWEHSTEGVTTDQMGFTILYQRRHGDGASSRIAILPPHVLNSEAPPMGRQLPSHQVLHLAAESTLLRKTVFQRGAKEVCRALHEYGALQPQLGLTRHYLQKKTQSVYRTSTDALMKKMEARTAEISTSDIKLLRQSASKFCFGLAYENNEQETPDSLAVRLRVHFFVAKWVSSLNSYKSAKLQLTRRGSPELAISPLERQEFPEQLKLSVELAFDALHAIPFTHDDYPSITSFIAASLDILEISVHIAYINHIYDMKVRKLTQPCFLPCDVLS